MFLPCVHAHEGAGQERDFCFLFFLGGTEALEILWSFY